MKFQHLIFALFLILQLSCNKEDQHICPQSEDFGTLLLSQEVETFSQLNIKMITHYFNKK